MRLDTCVSNCEIPPWEFLSSQVLTGYVRNKGGGGEQSLSIRMNFVSWFTVVLTLCYYTLRHSYSLGAHVHTRLMEQWLSTKINPITSIGSAFYCIFLLPKILSKPKRGPLQVCRQKATIAPHTDIGYITVYHIAFWSPPC